MVLKPSADRGRLSMVPGWFLLAAAILITSSLASPAAGLRIISPSSYVSGVPYCVRVEILDEGGKPDRSVWNSEVTLAASDSNVSLSANQVLLMNGVGTALITIQGTNGFTLEASSGSLHATRAVTPRDIATASVASGPLQGSTTSWSGLILLTGTVTVPTNHVLTIAPGTFIMVSGVTSGTAGIGLVVHGEIRSLGTESNPIIITTSDPARNWGQIRHENADPSTYRFTFISKGGRAPGEGHTGTGPLIRANNSAITFEGSILSDLSAGDLRIGKSMVANNSTLSIVDTVMSRSRMGPELMGTQLTCTNSYFTEMNGPDDADGIYLHDSNGRSLVMDGCVIAGGDDDAIDTLSADVVIHRSILRDWPNPNEDAKGVSVFHGQVLISQSLIANCYMGVAAKSSGALSVVKLDHCTIAGISRGVSAAWKDNATSGNIEIHLSNSIILAEDPLHSDFGPEKFVNVTYCNSAEYWLGTGNITGDPQFSNPQQGDYTLLPGSPCVNAGDPLYPLDPDSSRTDMGCFVFKGQPGALFATVLFPPHGSSLTAPTNLTCIAGAGSATTMIQRVEFFSGTNFLGEAATSPYRVSWPIRHVGSYTLWAVAIDSAGARATSAPITFSATSGASPTTNILVAAGGMWRYLDNGSDQGTNWSMPDFDDRQWKTGRAKLGYGDGDEATVLSYGSSSSSKYVTYYFRTSFHVEAPNVFTALKLRMWRDDGAILFLNGQEAFRINMPASGVGYRTYALSADDYAWATADLPVSLLRSGTNVLAVEVHQGSANSSDMGLNLELQAIMAPETNARPFVSINYPPDQSLVALDSSLTLSADAFDIDGTVSKVAMSVNGAPLGTNSTPPYEWAWDARESGPSVFTALAIDDSARVTTSQPLTVNISTNVAPPRIAEFLPRAGAVTNLEQIQVVFSKPVSGVDAADLLLAGVPAWSVVGGGTQFLFSVHAPGPGLRKVTWAPHHGITDTFLSPQPFDGAGTNASWQYDCVDGKPPVTKTVFPIPDTVVVALTNLVVTFDEPVQGVNAVDLLVNSKPAASVSGSNEGPYVFSFAPVPPGNSIVQWASSHGIRDFAGNALQSARWTYAIDPQRPRILINEIMYHPVSERPQEEYIELYNSESSAVDLSGWRFTKGISFTFTNAVIPSFGHLVIAANLEVFRTVHPGVTNVVGDWQGALSNSGEEIELANNGGTVVTRVAFADEGDWAIRKRSMPMFGQRGWIWYAEHDGKGKSLELVQPNLPNNAGQNWASSQVLGGTPGAPNSAFTNQVAPIITEAGHSPILPRSLDPVVISARVHDDAMTPIAVTLHYRVDSASGAGFSQLPMNDDGTAGDAVADDAVFAVRLPPFTNNSVIEYFISATDAARLTRYWPAPAVESDDGIGPAGQIVNALFQVDDTEYQGGQPVYRIVMKENERAQLQSIMDNVNQAANSDAEMNATFISADGTGTKLRYLASARNRGHGSRDAKPNNFRVMFRSDDKWNDVRALNLNGQYSWLQVLGAALHVKALSLGAYSQPVQLRVNNANLAFTGSTERTYGSYAANEAIGSEWAERHLPEDSEGNVYRAIRDLTPSNFDYRTSEAYPTLYGPEHKNSYTNTWSKETNESEDDWTDLIAMLRVFGPNGSEPYSPENVRRVINVEQWMNHLALMNLLGNSESGLNSGYNDDYMLYRGVYDNRFTIIYYDLDQILGYNRAFAANAQIFSAATQGSDRGSGAAFDRFLHHPAFEPVYYESLRSLIQGTLSAEEFDPLVDEVLGAFVPEDVRNRIKSYMSQRRDYVLSQLPPATSPAPRALLSGAPRSPSPLRAAAFKISGENVASYRFSHNGGPYSDWVGVATPLQLLNLPQGWNQISVVARTEGGLEQSASMASTAEWLVDTNWPSVRLNEVLASRSGNQPDLIELYNEGAAPVALAGFSLSDNKTQPRKYVFASVILGPGQYFVVSGNEIGFALNADGEGVYLFANDIQLGNLIDSVEFGPQLRDLSIGRLGNAGRWQLTSPTFGAANSPHPTASPGEVRINEWMALGRAPFAEDYIELHNSASAVVDVGDCFLTDQPLGAPGKSRIRPLSFIAPGAFMLFQQGGSTTAQPLDFGLSAECGEIGLSHPDMMPIHSVWYTAQSAGVAYGSCPDGSSTIKPMMTPTPGSANQCPLAPIPPLAVMLIPFTNAWTYNAFGTNLGSAWALPEFDDSNWSRGPGLIGFESSTLAEPLMTRISNPGYVTYYFRSVFTVPDGLNPSTYQVTHLIDDGAAFFVNGVEVAPRFNLSQSADYLTEASPSIGNAAYQTFLIPPSFIKPGTNLFAVEVHQSDQDSSDMVFGLRLEGIIITNVWGNTNIVLNEVVARRSTTWELDGSQPDWVELYNAADYPVDVTGMSLSDDVSQPQRWVFPDGSIIAGRGFLRILCDAQVAPGRHNTGFGLAANGGAVYLLDPQQNGGGLRNSIVYGLQAPDWSLARIPDGSGDWVLGIPSPAMPNLPASLGNAQNLRLNEWAAAPTDGSDWFEVYNPESSPIAVAGLAVSDLLSQPMQHVFPPLSFIGCGAGAYQIFFADDAAADGADHVGFKLSASGDTLVLANAAGTVLDAIAFGPQSNGVSEGRLPDGAAVQPVRFPGSQSPGGANFLPLTNVVINEVLCRATAPFEQAVELMNLSEDPLDVSGWYLSDSTTELRKFQMPAYSVIPGHGFLVVYERQFNGSDSAEPVSFATPKRQNAFLSEVKDGALTGFRAAASFGPVDWGVSVGRFPTSAGFHFTQLREPSFGVANPTSTDDFVRGQGHMNGYAHVGPVVISEIMYHPSVADDALEYVELFNRSAEPVPLYQVGENSLTWRLRGGIDFDFPSGVSIPAGGTVVLVSFDPAQNPAALASFQAAYGKPAGLLGPFQGKLDNAGETIELLRPGQNPPEGAGGQPGAAYVLVERVQYLDRLPWPVRADGLGDSLHRLNPSLYGDDPDQWVAGAPSPGTTDADHDGLPDAWERVYGLSPSDSRDAQLDADSDGVCALDEFLAGTKPNDSADRLACVLQIEEGQVQLGFRAMAGKAYWVETSDSLNAAAWDPTYYVPSLATSDTVIIAIGKANSTRFFRIRVE